MKKVGIILLALFISGAAFSQSISSSVVATAGASEETTNAKVSWTVGEVAVETIGTKGSTPILTQGFQQGYFEVTSIGDKLDNDFMLKLYPNPAIDFIWVEVKTQKAKSAVMEIYSMDGKLVYNKKWELINGAQQVDVTSLKSSQYILRVTDISGKVIQTFKLIKR